MVFEVCWYGEDGIEKWVYIYVLYRGVEIFYVDFFFVLFNEVMVGKSIDDRVGIFVCS